MSDDTPPMVRNFTAELPSERMRRLAMPVRAGIDVQLTRRSHATLGVTFVPDRDIFVEHDHVGLGVPARPSPEFRQAAAVSAILDLKEPSALSRNHRLHGSRAPPAGRPRPRTKSPCIPPALARSETTHRAQDAPMRLGFLGFGAGRCSYATRGR